MAHIARINEFFVEGKKSSSSHVLLHITEPTTAEEWKRGYFFAIAEIDNGNLELIGHAQRLIDDIESGYYETSFESGEKGPFETTLEFINRRTAHLREQKGTLHCLVGVIREDSISLSYHGDPMAHLFFLKKDGSIEDIDVLGGGDESDESHLFSAVIEGNINLGDKLFFGTPHITDTLSLKEIESIAFRQPLLEAATEIEQFLKQAGTDASYGGILCDLVEQTAGGPMPPSNSAASLQHLIDKQRETSETLSPPLFGKKSKASATPSRQQKRRNVIETNHRKRPGEDVIGGNIPSLILVGMGRALVWIGALLWKLLRWIAIGCSRVLITLFVLITNKNNGRVHALRSLKETWSNITGSISRLSIISKLLLLGVLILGITFAGSVTYLNIQEARKAAAAVYAEQVQAVADKREAAEARRIYNDDSGAYDLLKEAEAIVAALPQETDDQKATYMQLKEEVDDALLALRDITSVDASLVADLSSEGDVHTAHMIKLNDTLVAFGEDDNRLYLVDKDTGAISTQSHDSLARLSSGNTPKENDMMVFTGANAGVYIFNPENSALSKTEISFPSESATIAAPFIYNLRLYLVDTTNNQILRHSKTQTGYDRGTPWLKEQTSVDLSGAVSMAIDGDVYVLKQNGELLKFSGGIPTPFSISGLDPALDNPTDMYTYSDVESIYIVEPTNKRIVELNKQGTFKAQYTSELWQHPTGLVVDTDADIIYVLDGTKMYKFGI